MIQRIVLILGITLSAAGTKAMMVTILFVILFAQGAAAPTTPWSLTHTLNRAFA